jgi:leucyl aminopeptidase
MSICINKIERIEAQKNRLILINHSHQIPSDALSAEEAHYFHSRFNDENQLLVFNRYGYVVCVQYVKLENPVHIYHETLRRLGNSVLSSLQSYAVEQLQVEDRCEGNASLFLLEGMALGSYKFNKYKTKKTEKPSLKELDLFAHTIPNEHIQLLNIQVEATIWCRDLLNEPQLKINAITLTEEFQRMSELAGFDIEIFNKSKIESLKMGGLLGVNKGSVIPPTFSIMTWKPTNAINDKPIIFVGKGVVFDTGGLNLKTGDFMTQMHMDMGGAAAVATALFAIAKAKLPVYVMAMVPATDNRPGNEAITPNDILVMHNGTTVEVLNTDAEGRLILADALSYAQNYNPQLVIDLATLTGAAARAIGKYGIVAMRNSTADLLPLALSGDQVYERLVEFPMWNEYDELIKSEVADLKNIGGAEAGAITAGKFLEHFVDYPWIHLDIAGPAMLSADDSYRTKGGPGVGTRLLFNFILNLANQNQ